MYLEKFLTILFLFTSITINVTNQSRESDNEEITITRFSITAPTDVILWISNLFNRLVNTLILNNNNNNENVNNEENKVAVNKNNPTLIKQSNISPINCGLSRNSGLSLIDNKIVRGMDARKGQFPWQILLRIRDVQNNTFLCGGSLIAENWVLTAAHCVTNEKNGELNVGSVEVFAGGVFRKPLDKNDELQRRSVDCVIPNQKWKGRLAGLSNDIALLRIPNNSPFNITFPFGGNVNTMCLPASLTPPFEYTGRATVAGWGLTRDRLLFGQPSDVLKYTTVNTIDDKTCRRYPLIGEDIVDSMICQGIDRTAPCQGDSGGPLIIYPNNKEPALQIGIVSFGPGFCANSFIPNTIYTQVSYFADWVESTIKLNDGDAKCPTNELFSKQLTTSTNAETTTQSESTPQTEKTIEETTDELPL